MQFTVEELIKLAEAGANVNINVSPGAAVSPPVENPDGGPVENPPPSGNGEVDKYTNYRRLQMPDNKNRLVVYGVASDGLADGDVVGSYIYHGDDVEVLDFYPQDNKWFKVRIAAVGWHGQRGDPKTGAGAIGWLKMGDGGTLTDEPWRR